jgi:hypothetical protein
MGCVAGAHGYRDAMNDEQVPEVDVDEKRVATRAPSSSATKTT